jgi:predicted ribosome quality control (RQC) complex YloA/Tae2 family protein
MNYDALTLAAVRAALRVRILGGRVQRVLRPSALSLGMEIYTGKRQQLYLSAEPQEPTALLLDDKLRRGAETASPLQLLLRKYVVGARLRDVGQPPLERILRLDFEGEQGPVAVVCELMGRLSNLILLDSEGTVLDAAKRVPPSINRYRCVLPGRLYAPPPAQDKLHPLTLTADGLAQEMALMEGPLWRRLVNVVSGISPLLAREIVFRATEQVDPLESVDAEAYARVVEVIQDLWRLPETDGWAPSVAYQRQGDERHAVAYAPYALTHLHDYVAFETIDQALSHYLASREQPAQKATPTRDAYQMARRRVQQLIAAALDRQEARLASLQRAQVSEEELATLQLQASAILAVSWQIAPGQQALCVSPYQVTGDPADESKPALQIALDPSLSPTENAQALFREYRKRQAATAQVPALIHKVEQDLAYLRQIEAETALAEDRPQLDEIESALAAAGLGPRMQRKSHYHARPSEPLRAYATDGTLILVGRNSAQNEEVTFRRAGPSDLWLHAHDVPGAHVVIRCGDVPVAEETLLRAARLAAYYSANRHQPRVQVDYTPRRYVRPIKGGRPGMVTYREGRTLVVAPEAEGQQTEAA